VKKGQHLALDVTIAEVTHNANGDKFSYVYSPPLAENQGPQVSIEPTGELLVQATVEPDVDGDGFGDETQDKCPSQKSTAGACDVTPPAVTNLKIAHGKATYTLSEAATVSLQLQRKAKSGKFRNLGKVFAGPGNAGANKVTLPKVAKRPGAYRVQMTAADVVGNVANATKAFRVRARHRRR